MEITPTRSSMNNGKLFIKPIMRQLMSDLGFNGWWVSPTVTVNADSWEMAGVMSMIGRPGVYTGKLLSYKDGKAHFGPVNGTDVKKTMHPQLVTASKLSDVRVFPDSRTTMT